MLDHWATCFVFLANILFLDCKCWLWRVRVRGWCGEERGGLFTFWGCSAELLPGMQAVCLLFECVR